MFSKHHGRVTFSSMTAQSAWAIQCPLFTIFLQATIRQTAAILDARVSSKIALCLSVGHEGKDVVFSADRCPVQHADKTLNMYGFRQCLLTPLTTFRAVWQANSNHLSHPNLTLAPLVVVQVSVKLLPLNVNVLRIYAFFYSNKRI